MYCPDCCAEETPQALQLHSGAGRAILAMRARFGQRAGLLQAPVRLDSAGMAAVGNVVWLVLWLVLG